ncbi:MAG: ribosomal protein S18-alanine N-acetyltransferase [Galbitalea sp.]
MAAEIRLATAADLEAIMRIETSTFVTDAWSAETMRAELASPHTHYLVALADDTAGVESPDEAAPGALAGYAGLLAPRNSGDADIQTIAVVPAARRNGLGRRLMVELMTEAAARGARHVFLEVRADNPNARALYESLGFAQIAVRAHYYQPDDVAAVVMRVALAEGAS